MNVVQQHPKLARKRNKLGWRCTSASHLQVNNPWTCLNVDNANTCVAALSPSSENLNDVPDYFSRHTYVQ